MYAYIVLSLLAGVRTEEARALRWDHVDLDGDPEAMPALPAHVAVWRSVRMHGETKTKRSRRTLGLPRMAVEALRALRETQARERLQAGESWQDTGLVFTTHRGDVLDAGNVRKMFKWVCKEAGIGRAGRRKRAKDAIDPRKEVDLYFSSITRVIYRRHVVAAFPSSFSFPRLGMVRAKDSGTAGQAFIPVQVRCVFLVLSVPTPPVHHGYQGAERGSHPGVVPRW